MLIVRCQYFQFELMWGCERCKFFDDFIAYHKLNGIFYKLDYHSKD